MNTNRGTAVKSLLRIGDVVERTGIPRSTIFYLRKFGKFPEPVRISKRLVAWRVVDLERFEEALGSEQHQAAA